MAAGPGGTETSVNTSPFTIATNIMKYLGVTLTKQVKKSKLEVEWVLWHSGPVPCKDLSVVLV